MIFVGNSKIYFLPKQNKVSKDINGDGLFSLYIIKHEIAKLYFTSQHIAVQRVFEKKRKFKFKARATVHSPTCNPVNIQL